MACTPNEQIELVTEEGSFQPLVLYLVDERMELSKNYASHLEKVFDYTKIPFERISIDSLNLRSEFPPLAKVIYINNTEPLNEVLKEELLKFVAQGGTLVFPSLNEDQKAGFLSGIKAGADFRYNLETKGIHFRKNILPGLDGKKIYPQKGNIGLVKEAFKESINVLATSISDPTMPVIFEHLVGNGQVIHFNTFIEFEKQDRGLLFAAALKGLQGTPYPIANVSTIMIDDFPNPIYNIDAEPVFSEFGLSQAEFVLERWWPDMLKVAGEYELTYSAFPCFNYNTITDPPFIFTEWDKHETVKNNRSVYSSDWLMRQVLNNEFELGFHGYNHEPLLNSIWGNNPEYIEGALRAARKIWIINKYGAMPKSYVPPSNEIDSTGLVHLANAMPEVDFMASIYSGELSEGGNREFDLDPYEPRLFDFPRISSGYTFSDYKSYNIESLFLITGIWSHFIHPDDVYQLPTMENNTASDFEFRNAQSLGWHQSSNGRKGMLDYWREYLQHMKELHQSIRFMVVEEGASITRDWRETSYHYSQNGDLFDVEKLSTNIWDDEVYYWNIFIENNNKALLLKELDRMSVTYTQSKFFGGNLLTIKTKNPHVRFSNSINLDKRSDLSLKELLALVEAENKQYVNTRDRLLAGVQNVNTNLVQLQEPIIEDSVAWYVANENLKAATEMLLDRLKDQKEPALEELDLYALYLSYDNRPLEVWKYFEDVYQNTSHTLAITYVDHYLIKEAYPSAELNELWLRRKLLEDPGNLSLMQEYIGYFYSVENKLNLKNLLVALVQNNDDPEAYALYIKYLLDFEPETIIPELMGKDPERYPMLYPYATTITYNFSDSGHLQEALAWSKYSQAIPFKTILQWWINLDAYHKAESEFLEYIRENPNDVDVMAYMSNIWYDIGEFERAALIANKLPESDSLKSRFKDRINPDIRYFEPDIQKYLMVKTPTVIHPDTAQMIESGLRLRENNSVQYNTDYVVDNFKQSVWNNSATFNLRTSRLNQHSFSMTFSDVSDLTLTAFDVNNVPHTLSGLEYRFQTRENTLKPLFYAFGGIEQDDVSNTFYSFGTGISKSNQRGYKSIGYTFSPVKTGPAISRQIYWGQFIGYYETGYAKRLQLSLSPVLSHYTTGALEGSFTGRL
ncbi:MAG TPA: DUF2194 domain-containing protein, partial [Roseivirga sp.]